MNSELLVDPDGLRIPDVPAHLFQSHDHILAAIAEAGIDRRREARPCVDDGKNAQLPAGGELIVDEVHRPDVVRPTAFWRSSRSFAFTRRFGVLFLSCRPKSL